MPDRKTILGILFIFQSLFNEDCFDPFNLYGKSTSNSSGTSKFYLLSNLIVFCSVIDDSNLSLFDHYPSATGSNFDVDPFGTVSQPIRETNSPLNMFSSTLLNSNNNFFTQPQPQLIPTRPLTPTIAAVQLPMTVKNLSLNPDKKKNEVVTDLLDFSDLSLPPESPKFDPYA